MKQLQKVSRCRTYIRGKGSLPRMKESENNSNGIEHSNEELHVLIEYDGPENEREMCMQTAETLVKQLLMPPPSDEEDDLKKQQLKELAILNGTYRENKVLQPCVNKRVVPTATNQPVSAASAQLSANADTEQNNSQNNNSYQVESQSMPVFSPTDEAANCAPHNFIAVQPFHQQQLPWLQQQQQQQQQTLLGGGTLREFSAMQPVGFYRPFQGIPVLPGSAQPIPAMCQQGRPTGPNFRRPEAVAAANAVAAAAAAAAEDSRYSHMSRLRPTSAPFQPSTQPCTQAMQCPSFASQPVLTATSRAPPPRQAPPPPPQGFAVSGLGAFAARRDQENTEPSASAGKTILSDGASSANNTCATPLTCRMAGSKQHSPSLLTEMPSTPLATRNGVGAFVKRTSPMSARRSPPAQAGDAEAIAVSKLRWHPYARSPPKAAALDMATHTLELPLSHLARSKSGAYQLF